MAYVLGIPLLAVLAILQSAVLSHLRFLDGRPDLVLLAVIGWSLTGRWKEAMIGALVGGAFLDLLSGLPFGSSSLALVVIAYVVSLTEGRLWQAHFLTAPAVTLVASLFFYFFGLGVAFVAGATVDLQTAMARIILPGTFLNILLAIPAAQLSGSFQRWLFPAEVEI